uniref:NADP-dependent oxidoreductase domain-containing protein n=1 Tax=Parascaris univalens TaxID=6257 RepID=A0A915BSX2_PARUN
MVRWDHQAGRRLDLTARGPKESLSRIRLFWNWLRNTIKHPRRLAAFVITWLRDGTAEMTQIPSLRDNETRIRVVL